MNEPKNAFILNLFILLNEHKTLQRQRRGSKIGRWITVSFFVSIFGGTYFMLEFFDPISLVPQFTAPLLLILDFCLRSILVDHPKAQIFPYLCLPIKRNHLLLFMILSEVQTIWVWGCFPIYFLLLVQLGKITSISAANFLLFVILNHYISMLIHTLIMKYVILLFPIFLIGIVTLLWLYPIINPVVMWLLSILIILLIGKLLHSALKAQLYQEVTNTSYKTVMPVKTRIHNKTVADNKTIVHNLLFEWKLLIRNKWTRHALFTVLFFSLYACIILPSNSIVYDYFVWRMIFLTALFSMTGIYFGIALWGIMAPFFEILNISPTQLSTVVRTKYYLYLLISTAVAVAMLPFLILHINIQEISAAYLFSIGFIYCSIFVCSIFNCQPIDIKDSYFQHWTGNSFAYSFLLPLTIFAISTGAIALFYWIVGEYYTLALLSFIGIISIATHKLWIQSICNVIKRKKYGILEKFRNP